MGRCIARGGSVSRLGRHSTAPARSSTSSRCRIEDEELRGGFLDGVASIIPPAPSPSAARIAKAEADGLTRRERDVARLVALGKANKVIAHDLGIGERTVEGYVASALAKLGFDSRARLAAWAVTKGLAEPAHPVPTPRAD